ncbi:MAG: metal-dependent hydrolase [Bacillota bacterium]
MDNITHALIGLTANSLLKEKNKTTFWISLISSELPDIDILYRLKSSAEYMLNHRGFSHSLPGLFLMAGIVTLVAGLLSPGADRKKIFLLSSFCLILHVAFDVFTSWGTQLFFPIWDRWFYLDFVPIIDLVIIIIAAAALIAGRLAPGRRRIISLAGTLLIILFLLGRFAGHEYLVNKYQALYLHARVSVMAGFSPLDWKVIVEKEDQLLSGKVSLIEKESPELGVTPVARQDAGRYMSNPQFYRVVNFFRYPVYTVKEFNDGKILVINDLYYGFRQVMFPLDENYNIAGRPLRSKTLY